MNRRLPALFVVILLALAPGVFQLAADESAASLSTTVSAGRLRCEYLINPLGLDVAQPRLDWILTGPSELPRHVTQVAYQILVASSPDLLAQDKGDLWDSGVVKSGDTDHIAYAGSALKSREACYWKVRSTDSLGHVTDWSQPASWEMGLLAPGDWQAKWIEAPISTELEGKPAGTIAILHASYEGVDGPGSADVTALVAPMLKDNALAVLVDNKVLGGDPARLHKKQLVVTYADGPTQKTAVAGEGETLTIPRSHTSFPYLRKDFTLGKTVAKARLYATALGLYELHLNGQRVGDHLFAPDWTDYSKRSRYQAYDVTSLFKPDANTLAGFVGNGWYSGHIGNGGFQAWGKVPALFAQLEVTYTDGTTERIVTDASWKKHGGPILHSDFMLGEDYDAELEIAGWDQPGLDVSTWTAVSERTEADRPLEAQVDQPVRQTGELHPKTVKEPKPGQFTFDFGQNMVGVLRIKVNAPAGTRVTLHHAEMLNGDGTIYTRNLRGASSVDTYICKGDGEETWQPRFTFHGFRYAEVTGLPQAPTTDTITGIVVGTDIPHVGEFTCSNPAIDQLQSNIQWGMRGNYLSVPTDCPQRDERMGWMGDAQVFVRTAAYNGDIAAFFTKWLVDVDDAQSPAGWFTDVSPIPPGTKKYGFGGVPAWGDAGVICPWTIYLMYGDKRILQQHLPAMTKWVDYLQSTSTGFIRDKDRGHDYGDWLSQGANTPKEVIATAYMAYSTSLVAQAYAATGDTANASKYEAMFEQIKDAFNKKYVDADGHIQGGTQACYDMALRFQLLPENLRAKAGQYLADDVKAHDDHLTTGFVGVSYLLPALTAENKIDTAYRLFLQDTFPSWLFSVKQGATTIWERWDGWTPEKGFQNPSMNSFNHYSLGSCGEWMFDTVAGIGVDPKQPGFGHIIIHPQPGGNLTGAQGTFDSIHGKILTEWTLRDGKFMLHTVIPLNTTATFVLPTTNAASVLEQGRPIASHPEITPVPDAPGVQYLVGSGDYTFTCTVP